MIPRFCIQSNITSREATPCSVSHLIEVMSSDEVQDICDRIKLEDGQDKDEIARLKRQLPVITPHAQRFENNERKNCNAIPSGLVMLDIDGVSDPRAVAARVDDAAVAAHRIYMVAITPSGHGLRVIAERNIGESIADAQQRLATLYGVTEYDSATKDLARASYVMPYSYVLLLNQAALEFDSQDEADATAQQFQDVYGTKQGVARGGGGSDSESQTPPAGNTYDSVHQSDGGYSESYKGISYKTIVDELVSLLGGTPQQGERNTFYFTLVKYVRYICDFNAELVLQVLPDFGLSETERRQVITSALNRPRKSYIPDTVQRAITAAEAEVSDEARGQDGEKVISLPLPKLPHVLEVICKRLPEPFRPAMVIAALPVLGTLATKVRFNYLDHQEHSFSFMSCITAPAATGKSFIRRPVNLLLTPIDEQDDIEREKEQEYKEKLRAAKNSKMQPENPRACPRNNGINISIAKLLQLLSYSEGKHLIGIGEEIDTLVKSERAGVWSQKSDIYRLGFDNAKYGQNYMSDNSFSANVPVYYNLLLTGTPGGMYRFFKDVEDGLVTRFAFAQLPDMFGTDIPDFQPYTTSEESEIIRIARMLDMASGTIICPAVDEAISQWLQQKKEAAIAADSRAIDTIRKRAAVMGFRAGYLAALLNGSARHISSGKSSYFGKASNDRQSRTKSSKSSKGSKDHTEDNKIALAVTFAQWVAEYIFQNQMQLFGDKFETVANEWENQQASRGTVRGLLSKLPEVFSRADVMQLRVRNGQSTRVNMVIHRWIESGLIEQTEPNKYRKSHYHTIT